MFRIFLASIVICLSSYEISAKHNIAEKLNVNASLQSTGETFSSDEINLDLPVFIAYDDINNLRLIDNHSPNYCVELYVVKPRFQILNPRAPPVFIV